MHPDGVEVEGRRVQAWRGVPMNPCDKIPIDGNKTDVLLLRTGERKRGVVGLFQPGLPGEISPSLSVRMMGINQSGGAQYLLSLYCSVAVMTHDALGVLEGVLLDQYYEYT